MQGTNPRPQKHNWRTDIQGLRAVAVGLVVAAHVGLPHLAGGFVGVDVFFVLSGYLITTLLLREADRTGRVSIPQFYVRRARRILPAATLVIVVVLAYATFRLPQARLGDVAQDGGWAAFFLANVHFAKVGVDYFHPTDPSVFQHYWSLSVEEQFYLVWPLLAMVVAARFGRRWFAAVAGAVFVGSLVWSLHLTATDPTAAYFSTPARAYELAAGALLACVTVQLKKSYATILAIIGAVLIAAATLGFGDASPFPGWRALVPVLGTVALLAAGPETVIAKVLSVQPFRYVGDISYSLYLWHWPLIVLAPTLIPDFGHDLWRTCLAALIAVALAALSHRFVEVPFQTRKVPGLSAGLRPLLLWPVGLALALGSGWASMAWADHSAHQRDAEARAWLAAHESEAPSAAARPAEAAKKQTPDIAGELKAAVALADKGAPIPPAIDPKTMGDDSWQKEYGDCYAGYGDTVAPACALGDPKARRTLAVVGDSHAGMWLTALDELARQRHVKVVPFVKLGCAPYAVKQRSKNMTQGECDAFRAATTKRLQKLRPDGVVATARGELFMSPKGGRSVNDQWTAAVHEEATSLTAVSPHVTVVGDVLARGAQPDDCISAPGADQLSCLRAPTSREATSNKVTESALTGTRARYVDVMDLVCAGRRCPLVVGDLATYYDDSHLSRSWVEHVTPRFAQILGRLTA